MVYSDIAWEGSLKGPDFTVLKNIGTLTNMRITVGGGVGGPKQLWDLQQLTSIGLDSVIVGRALYENRFPCQRMWRTIEAKLEPSIVANEI
jgi:phosphoribosylformimino-5-aminoimidazole carboxamide ribotide isomerase